MRRNFQQGGPYGWGPPPPAWDPNWQYASTSKFPKIPKKGKDDEDEKKSKRSEIREDLKSATKKRELLILMCTQERHDSLSMKDAEKLKELYPNIKIRLRPFAQKVTLKTATTMEMLCPALTNLKNIPSMVGLLVDEKILEYNVKKLATNSYNKKKTAYDKEARKENVMIDSLVIPDYNAEKDQYQRNAEWENYGLIRDFIANSSQRNELKRIRFGLIIDRSKATNLTGPLARASIDPKVTGKINYVHMSDQEMDKQRENPNFSEIFYYLKRLAAIMSSKKARYMDGTRRGLRSESDSDTDKEN